MMFALAARYEVPDAAVEAEALNRMWTAGDDYLLRARELLYLYSICSIMVYLTVRFVDNLLLPCTGIDVISWSGTLCIILPSDSRGLVWLGVGHIPAMPFVWLKIWVYIGTQLAGWMLFQC
jgi:hypothetical protein